MIVIDTRVLIWMAEGDGHLGQAAIQRIDRERAGDGVRMATITLWETAMLVDRNKAVPGYPPRQ